MIDRLARWMIERQKMFVKHPERARRMFVVDAVIFVVTFACWVVWPRFVGTWVGIAISVVVGLQLGRTAALSTRRAATYRSGWLDGRSQMMSALSEALRRGIGPVDFAAAELQRDMATLGETIDIDEVRRQMLDGDDDD